MYLQSVPEIAAMYDFSLDLYPTDFGTVTVTVSFILFLMASRGKLLSAHPAVETGCSNSGFHRHGMPSG
jgi:hypothetical protein